MKSLGGSEEAPCRLPTAPPLSLRQLCGGLLSGTSVSCTPLWPTVPCLLAASPAPFLAHSPRADSLGCSAWINLLVFPVQPGDIPSRVASVHLSETTLHMLGEHSQNWVSKDAHGPRVSLPFLCNNYKGNSSNFTMEEIFQQIPSAWLL